MPRKRQLQHKERLLPDLIRKPLTEAQVKAVREARAEIVAIAGRHAELTRELVGMLKFFRTEIDFPKDINFDLSKDDTEMVEVKAD